MLLGSTYSADNHAIYDGMGRRGTRLVSFAPDPEVWRVSPARDSRSIQKIGEEALARPVEIEFAVRLARARGELAEFGFLQMRPLVLSREGEEMRIEEVDPGRLLCQSTKCWATAALHDLRDIVVVDFHRFERARSHEVAAERRALQCQTWPRAGTPYLLIGVRPLGIERSVARHSRGVGTDFRSARDCGSRLPRFRVSRRRRAATSSRT